MEYSIVAMKTGFISYVFQMETNGNLWRQKRSNTPDEKGKSDLSSPLIDRISPDKDPLKIQVNILSTYEFITYSN